MSPIRGSRGGGGQGVRTPLIIHKIIGFLSNTGPDSLRNQQLAFNFRPPSARQRNAISMAFRGPLYRRVAEFHISLTFWENLPHRHKGWNRSQIKTKCLFLNFDWVVRSKIGSIISKKGEITLSLQKRQSWSTNFEKIFCIFRTLFFRKLFYFLNSI